MTTAKLNYQILKRQAYYDTLTAYYRATAQILDALKCSGMDDQTIADIVRQTRSVEGIFKKYSRTL